MRDLTKWPRLLVKGDSITHEQAAEVLIRTCAPDYLDGSDPSWTEYVGMVMGMDLRDKHPTGEMEKDPSLRIKWYTEQWDRRAARAKELGILKLGYLYNSRIASSHLGGPHGWCDWDGTISACSYNIGKWPTEEDVTEEWTMIAEVFPFLDLRAQLISHEGGYEINGVEYPGELCGEWQIRDGKVTVDHEPKHWLFSKDQIIWANGAAMDPFMEAIRRGQSGERGVGPDHLRRAVELVERKMQG